MFQPSHRTRKAGHRPTRLSSQAEIETEERTIQVSTTPMVDFEELETRGWSRAKGVSTREAMLELANADNLAPPVQPR